MAATYAEAASRIKSDEEINKLSAPQAKAYAKELSANYHSLISNLFKPETGIIAQLQKQLADSQRVNESLLRQLTAVERIGISNAQYVRRETLELHGVPAAFDEGAGLEAKVIDLMNTIAPEAKIVPADVQAIHRLKKKENVIIKFVSRKKKQQVIIKRARLRETSIRNQFGIVNERKIFLNESMSFPVKSLFFYCRMLKQRGKIHYYTFFNGNLKVQMEEDGDKMIIGHVLDLVKLTGLSRIEIEELKP